MTKFALGIETSCDDTCASIVDSNNNVLSSVRSSQVKLHSNYGGVVPELASRKHAENMPEILEVTLREAQKELSDIDLIAVTRGPGLVGPLLVGMMTAKGLAWTKKIPLVGINHLRAHLWASVLDELEDFPAPALSLIISGGHTELLMMEGSSNIQLLGQTRDDAAGEAFDKVARILDLGYPGGPPIDARAREYEGKLIDFPRPMISDDSLDFSFSGLKTAVSVHLEEMLETTGCKRANDLDPQDVSAFAASFQEAVIDVLEIKVQRALKKLEVDTLVVAGGVAANRQLRDRFNQMGETLGVKLIIPPPKYCTDNAAMVAANGFDRWKRKGVDGLSVDVDASLSISSLCD